jgi:hypothetical protein
MWGIFAQNRGVTARLHRLETSASVQAGVSHFSGTTEFRVTGVGTQTLTVAPGIAYVPNTFQANQGMYQVYNDANATVTVTTGHATLPRIDQVILRVNDTAFGSGSNSATVSVLAGTATSGAQLSTIGGANYRAGAAALPASSIRLADVFVAATDTTINQADIVDRRQSANGAVVIASPAAATQVTLTTTAALALTLGTVELSGAPVELCFFANGRTDTQSNIFHVDWRHLSGTTQISGSAAHIATPGMPGFGHNIQNTFHYTPTAGRHNIQVYASVDAAVGNTQLNNMSASLREIV